MNISELSVSQLKRVISLKEKLAGLEAELASLIGSASKVEPAPKKKGMSAAGRKAVAAAQKKRWAKIKAQTAIKSTAPKPAAPKAKKKISAAGIARIKAAQKARWAKVKAAKA